MNGAVLEKPVPISNTEVCSDQSACRAECVFHPAEFILKTSQTSKCGAVKTGPHPTTTKRVMCGGIEVPTIWGLKLFIQARTNPQFPCRLSSCYHDLIFKK
jgi:hypothetical protein